MFLKLPFCEEILLQENEITAIKAGSFNELTSVLLNVSHNQLTTVEKGAFTNVVNITVGGVAGSFKLLIRILM